MREFRCIMRREIAARNDRDNLRAFAVVRHPFEIFSPLSPVPSLFHHHLLSPPPPPGVPFNYYRRIKRAFLALHRDDVRFFNLVMAAGSAPSLSLRHGYFCSATSHVNYIWYIILLKIMRTSATRRCKDETDCRALVPVLGYTHKLSDRYFNCKSIKKL